MTNIQRARRSKYHREGAVTAETRKTNRHPNKKKTVGNRPTVVADGTKQERAQRHPDPNCLADLIAQAKERKKQSNPLQEGPLKVIGSSVDMQSYKGGVGINFRGH